MSRTIMHNHPHPGEVIKDLLERNTLSVAETAIRMKVSRHTVSKLINCHSRISPEMAVRLTALFGSSIGMWLRLQAGYDEWKAVRELKHIAKKITKLKASKVDIRE